MGPLRLTCEVRGTHGGWRVDDEMGGGTTWTRKGEADRCRRMREELNGVSLIACSGGEQMAR
jgi:hypothetical protein